MNRLRRAAVLARLDEKLLRKGSWCGETHLQKAMYFLQRLLKVPTGFDFILYKHGPFSFDLRDELAGMRADGLLDLCPQLPYGPSLIVTDAGTKLEKKFPRTLKRYEKHIRFVAEQLGSRNVADLERLATALYVTSRRSASSVEVRAKELHHLKPHVSIDEAVATVKTVDKIVRASRSV